ncbi:MAG: response regulator [Planctomycetota bacterium]
MAQGLRILVIDDDKSVRDILAQYLKGKGFEPLLAKDGLSGLDLLKRCPDIVMVLLDWMMPGMDGIQVLREIQVIPDAPPVAMLTAKMGKNDVIEALKSGAADYMVKPIQRDAFLKKVMGVLNRSMEKVKVHASKRRSLDLDCALDFVIQDVSETGCALLSPFPIPPGELVPLQSPELSERLREAGTKTHFLRVARCKEVGKKYCIGGEFVGLAPEAVDNLIKSTIGR